MVALLDSQYHVLTIEASVSAEDVVNVFTDAHGRIHAFWAPCPDSCCELLRCVSRLSLKQNVDDVLVFEPGLRDHGSPRYLSECLTGHGRPTPKDRTRQTPPVSHRARARAPIGYEPAAGGYILKSRSFPKRRRCAIELIRGLVHHETGLTRKDVQVKNKPLEARYRIANIPPLQVQRFEAYRLVAVVCGAKFEMCSVLVTQRLHTWQPRLHLEIGPSVPDLSKEVVELFCQFAPPSHLVRLQFGFNLIMARFPGQTPCRIPFAKLITDLDILQDGEQILHGRRSLVSIRRELDQILCATTKERVPQNEESFRPRAPRVFHDQALVTHHGEQECDLLTQAQERVEKVFRVPD